MRRSSFQTITWRTSPRRTAETELFLFLTPRVLRTDEEVEGATRDYRERAPEGARQAVPAQPEVRP